MQLKWACASISTVLFLHLVIIHTMCTKPASAGGWFRSIRIRILRKYRVHATGCAKCEGEAIKGVKIVLMDNDFPFDKTMGTTTTDSSGCFSVSGEARDIIGKPDPLIKIQYEYGDKLRIRDRLGFTRRYKTPKRSYSENINFGDINDPNTDNCKAYIKFYNAIQDYIVRVKRNIPYGKLVVTSKALAVTPYAPHTSVKVPEGENLNDATAQHELAHTIRHHYDGSYFHFSWDATRFWYLRSHNCNTSSNHGFAFNEGWAEFWEKNCYVSSLKL